MVTCKEYFNNLPKSFKETNKINLLNLFEINFPRTSRVHFIFADTPWEGN